MLSCLRRILKRNWYTEKIKWKIHKESRKKRSMMYNVLMGVFKIHLTTVWTFDTYWKLVLFFLDSNNCTVVQLNVIKCRTPSFRTSNLWIYSQKKCLWRIFFLHLIAIKFNPTVFCHWIDSSMVSFEFEQIFISFVEWLTGWDEQKSAYLRVVRGLRTIMR